MTPRQLRIGIVILLMLMTGCVSDSNPEKSTYPSKPIKVIVPFGAGGETDTFARIIQKGIEDNQLLPVPLVILNRNGAGGTIGSRSVKNAEPDGYTILLLHDALFTAKHAKQVKYGPEAFTPVAGTGEAGMFLAVSQTSHFDSLQSLMQSATEQQESVGFGVNMGAVAHFAGLLLESKAKGAKFRFSQTGSGAERFAELAGGHIDATVFSTGEFVRFQGEGIKGLAYFGDKRHPAFPDIPTATEQGYPLENSNMQFWWFPKGTPEERVRYFASVLEKAMATAYVRDRLAELQTEPIVLTGEELKQRIVQRNRELGEVPVRTPDTLPNWPNILLVIVSLLGLWITVRGMSQMYTAAKSQPPSETKSFNWQVVCSLILFLSYVVLLSTGVISYPLATTVFLVVLTMTLTNFRWRTFPFALAIALLFGVGLYAVMTNVFTVDLP